MRTLIITNAQMELDHLAALLHEHFPLVQVVSSTSAAHEGIQLMVGHQPELVLVEAGLPEPAMASLLALMGSRSCAFVLVAADYRHAVHALRFAAADFLLKPVSKEALAIALQRAHEQLGQQQLQRRLLCLVDFVKRQQAGLERLPLPLANETRLPCYSAILYCLAKGSYTHFYLEGGEQLVVARGLYQFTAQLESHGFVQASQSAMVNTCHVKSLLRKDNVHELLLLDGHTKVHVSRSCLERVKERVYGGK